MSLTKPEQDAISRGDQRRPAARRTALILALVAVGIYGAFFLRAVLNS